MALPRRYYNVLILSLIATLATYLFLYRSYPTADVVNVDHPLNVEWDDYRPKDVRPALYIPTTTTAASPNNISPNGDKQELGGQGTQEATRIAITESGGSHDEVTAALIHAFGKQPNTETSIFLLLQRYGISDVIDSFNLSAPIMADKASGAFEASLENSPHPNILVAATCEIEIVKLAGAYDKLLAEGKTFLVCVIHHADRWVEGEHVEKVRPWVEKDRVRFVGLSEHTANYFRTECATKWTTNTTVLVDYLPPVFPVDIKNKSAVEGKQPLTFALQGDYDPSRRNYTSTFEQLSEVIKMAPNRTLSQNVSLHLIGHGKKPEVPEMLKSHVSFDENLDYTAYYSLVSKAFALLPSFASKDYYDRKASSTVPAALIAGAPLVANAELLETYTYLDESLVWKQEEGESEMDVVKRVVQLSAAEHNDKKMLVREACGKIVEKNVVLVAEWIKDGLEKIIS